MTEIGLHIKFTKLILKNVESGNTKQNYKFKKKDELNNNNEEKIILLYPLSGKFITESKYKEINNINNIKNQKENIFYSNQMKKRLSSDIIKRKISFTNKSFYKEQDNYINYTNLQLKEEIKKLEKKLDEEKNNDKIEKELIHYIKLSNKWKKIAQDSIYNLLEIFPKNEHYEKNTINSVLNNFHIDKKLIGYDEENDCFIDE